MNVDPETGIWSLKIAKKRHKFDESLAAAIHNLYSLPMKAVDIGCGSGMYCRYFADKGWDIVGLEGTADVTMLGIYEDIVQVDLSKPIHDIYYFDFSLCLEVGEHIPKKHEQQFIENVCKLSRKYLVLSWAVPGQYSASGHVNCQPNDYVIDEFRKRCYEHDVMRTRMFRLSADFDWFRNTLMCFVRR